MAFNKRPDTSSLESAPIVSAWDLARSVLLAVLLFAPLARGAVLGWPLAVTQLLSLFALGAWLWAMIRQRRLEWRRTALDRPLALMFLLVLLQLALGNADLRAWALAPPAPAPAFTADVPARFWTLGTVASRHTWQALGFFATYAAIYVLTVNLIRERRQLQSFIRILVFFGAALAFAGLLEYIVGESWILRWKAPYDETRLRATFASPDHFASWLAMLVCLGVGALAAGRPRRREGTALSAFLASRELREDLVRRYLPFLAVVIASLAVIFTLSRGGIMSLLVGLGAMLLVFARLGWLRWGVAAAGGLGAVTLIYATWIGLGPLVARIELDASRWLIAKATFPMLAAFPVFGTGLGTYQEIFFRYQTAELAPGRLFYSDAHNDWLQLVVETGAIGTLIAGWMAWRLIRDLFGAHLLGHGRCPVGGGEGELAQRHDPFSVGIGVGALGAVLAFAVHLLVEFPARIPADGALAAACLGVATVALHTRFDRQPQLLTERWTWSFRGRRLAGLAVGLAAAVVLLAPVPWIVRRALTEAALAWRGDTISAKQIDAALAIDPWDPGALTLRAEARADRAWQEKNRALAESAIADFRSALAAIPSNAFTHERLGWAYEVLSTLDPARASEHAASALAHLKRAIAMGPDNPYLHRSLAAFAVRRPETFLAIGLEAARETVARDPTLLPDLVDRFQEILGPDQWLALVPAASADRLELGHLLETRGRLDAAETAYRTAIESAPADERAVGVWMLAVLLTRKGNPAAAAKEIERALPSDPGNPELLLVYGRALEAQGKPAALDVYRAAVTRGAPPDGAGPSPFKSESPRVRSLVADRIGAENTAVRYRRALARYLGERRLWAQAGAEWDAVLQHARKDAEGHFFRAVAWEEAGQRDRALEHYREALAVDDQPRFRLRFARLLWHTEQYFPATNEWRAVLKVEPDNVEAHLGLAQAHLKEGDRLAAFRHFRRVLAIVPGHPVARREVAVLTGAAR